MNESPLSTMDSLIRIGIDFLLSYIKDESLPQSSLDQFASELENAVMAKYKGHWYPQQPAKGSAYRCIVVNGKLHPLLEQAAKKACISMQTVVKHFPTKLYLWIDPDEVSYRINEQRSVTTLYSVPNANGLPHYNIYNQGNDYKMPEQLKSGLVVSDSFTPTHGSGESPKGFYTRNKLWIPTTASSAVGHSQSYSAVSEQQQFCDLSMSRNEMTDNFVDQIQGSPAHQNHYQHFHQGNNIDYRQSGTTRNNTQMNHFTQYEVVVN